ncbi:MAG: carboxypeptidase-like regulatory domain-containing protein [Polyangiales bacterium]
MRLIHLVCLPALLVACTDPPLPERLDEPDVAISASCAEGTTEVSVAGTVIDHTTGVPVAGATVDITEAWAAAQSFPASGCRMARLTTDASGRFGPIMVKTYDSTPIMVMLVTGGGRAPTIADRRVGCFFGCTGIDETIAAPSEALAMSWREELYAGGMPYALNRGLVAFTFLDSVDAPASGVSVKRMRDTGLDATNGLDLDIHALPLGTEGRFLSADGMELEKPDHDTTTYSGSLLAGSEDAKTGYFRIGGDKGIVHWPSVGVMVATGWIYVETGHP